MDFAPSPRAADLARRVRTFVDTEVEPLEPAVLRDIAERRARGEDAWPPPPVVDDLKARASSQGLWNLFLPAGHGDEYAARFGTDGGTGLTNTDYATVAEQMGHSALAPLVLNCNAPDTGNMEVLLRYGSAEQQEQWLEPLLDGRVRSTFLMTEPGVASSDATTMEATATLDGDDVVLDGRKWWSTGAGHPDCAVGIFMGLTDPGAHRHAQHSMVVVPLDAPGVRVERMLTALGQYDEPLGHGEVALTGVRLPRQHPRRPRPRLRDRPGPSRTGPGPPLHASHRPRREGARPRLPRGPPPGWRSASPSPTSAATANASPARGSRSTRPACSCSTPRGSSTPSASRARSPRSRRSRRPSPDGVRRHRPRDPAPRRRRHQRGLPPRRRVCRRPQPAPRRRPRRGAPRRRRTPPAPPVRRRRPSRRPGGPARPR